MAELKPFLNIPPGDFIKEELEERGWTQADLSEILGLSEKSINQIINGKQRIMIDTARMLSKAFGQSPQYWLNLDMNFRLRDQPETQAINDVEIKSTIYKYMPVKEMIQKNWIKSFDAVGSLVKQVVEFWQIHDLDFEFLEKEAASLHFRKSAAYRQFNVFYALTWFQQARRIAQMKSSKSYNRDKLIEITNRFGKYTIKEDGVPEFLQDVTAAGIQFIVLSHLQKTYIDAASFYCKQNPVIVYTSRYDRVDHFWFSMAHEIAHVLNDLVDEDDYFIDDMDSEAVDEKEKNANQFASQLLKHPEIFKMFLPNKKYVSEYRVRLFANSLNIHPGIIVGALQYRGWLSPKNLNKFKEKVMPKIPNGYYFEDVV